MQTILLIRCRPVQALYTEMWLQLVAGESVRPLGLWAVGPDSGIVTLLAGDIHVGDTAIATLSGRGIRLRAPGHTVIISHIGDAETATGVTVYQPVPSLDSLTMHGPVMCMPDFGPGVDFVDCLVRGAGASITVAHPGTSGGTTEGRLTLGRQDD